MPKAPLPDIDAHIDELTADQEAAFRMKTGRPAMERMKESSPAPAKPAPAKPKLRPFEAYGAISKGLGKKSR